MESKTFVYILLCKNNKYYCGMTSNLINRMVVHTSGMGAVFTRKNKPLNLIHLEELPDREKASKREMELTKVIKNNGIINFKVLDGYQGLYKCICESLLKKGYYWTRENFLWNKKISKEELEVGN